MKQLQFVIILIPTIYNSTYIRRIKVKWSCKQSDGEFPGGVVSRRRTTFRLKQKPNYIIMQYFVMC